VANDYSAAFALDPQAASDARDQRFKHFQTVDIPRLRVIGFFLNALGVIVHNWLVQGRFSLYDSFYVTSVLLGYAFVAWGVIRTFWSPKALIDISDFFLVFDVVVLAFIVYVSGANHSLMWIIFIARPADQVATTYRRSLFFAHLGPLAFLGLMLYVSGVEHREVVWPVEIAKGTFLYIMSMYIALTARTAEARRNKLAEARRTAEQAVRAADQRRRELEAALSKLEDASKAKSEFLANVSHELRTPLNSVLGSSDLLLDSPLSREQREMVGVLRDSAESLTHIVNDILDLARVEARRMLLEHIPMRLRDVAGATLRMFTARAHHRPIELVCHVDRDVPDALTGDPVRLRQVLTNLIGNAVKFTEAGEIVLRVEREEERPGRIALRFSIRDTGIGIPRDRQAAIFEAFTQVDGSSTRKYGGTGLGLTIANELVGLMDGRLWVDSEPGRGSTFSFIAWFGHSGGTDATVESPWGSVPQQILIADGNAAARAALHEALSVWPAEIRSAGGGHAALTAVSVAVDTTPIDLAFIDAGLPGIDAFELAARLRAAPFRVPRVVLMLRDRQSPLDAERAVASGAMYLVKPVTSQTLTEFLRGAFGKDPHGAGLLPHTRPPVRPLKILVADDHEVNQAVVGAMLKKWGHGVASAFDGQEVLDKLAGETYDLILMDLQMPLMDGLEATRRLRQREAADGTGRLPVIAMTARAMDEDRERCLAAGMNGYLSKPINQHALFNMLAEFGEPSEVVVPAEPDPSSIAPVISDPGLVRHVASLYLSTAPSQLARLVRALELGDAPQARAIAHSINGATAYFAGADTSACVAIEDLCANGHADRALTHIDQLRADIDALSTRLRAFLQ
jgi:signal transduction histidine kinase/DNA-binding response OmpR family regulator/HPt (histidine-containing phosphotransfer) domain-containing protein